MFLDEIIEKRKVQLEREKSEITPEEMKKRAENAELPIRGFKAALMKNGLSVISEVKKASPSKGLIQPDFDPVKIAAAYENAGANAISCLTEESYFQGSSRYLADICRTVKIPVLRKDFVIDSYQIYEARALGASAVLLIAAALDDSTLSGFYALARSLDLDVLAEAHDEEEISRLVKIGCEIIGVNNRDLRTFEVSLENTRRLRKFIPEGTVFVCESGIKNNADMHFARDSGADAVLIGETLMRSGLSGIPDCMSALREGTI